MEARLLEGERVPRRRAVHPDHVSLGVLPLQHRQRQRVLHQPLDRALQGPGPEHRVVAFARQQPLGRRRDVERRASSRPAARRPAPAAGPRSSPVCSGPSGRKMTTSSTRFRNSGRKCWRSASCTRFSTSSQFAVPISRIHWLPRLLVMMITVLRKSTVRPWRVGEPPVVQDLQQHVEHVGVRLLDLVEQQHAVGPAADGLGELPAFLVAHVARRRADHPRHRVLLHVLRHVEPHQRPLVVEQELRQRPRRLGLADAGRAQEDERAGRPVGIGQARARAPHGVRHRGHRLRLADHPRAEMRLERAPAAPSPTPSSASPGSRSTAPRSRRRPPRPPPP